ncbi:MAG: NAD(P)-dependent oxidoreductase [Alphaproteobacteria bacterium]|nr:NAD(P)-dependent oxidoreductase [Alphaproteobacteria bacterium]
MRVLIFGGAGFVGLGIAEAALARGDDVVLFDRRPPPDVARQALDGRPGRLASIVGDTTDAAHVRNAFNPTPDVVVYGAALTADAVRELAEPERILDVNVGGLVRALQAARSSGVRRVILLSSAAAYGDSALRPGPLDEDTPPTPRTLYAISKLSGELVARRLAELGSIDVRIVRLSSVFGPWEHASGVRDTLSPPYQIALAALHGRPALLPRPCNRDFVYVRDVAGAVLALVDAPALRHDLYNVGPGASWSLLDWGQRLARVARDGFVCRVCVPGEIASIDLHGAQDRSALAIRRLTEDLGYTPRYGLVASADDYIEWLARHGALMQSPPSHA